jgi:hypothetical protein
MRLTRSARKSSSISPRKRGARGGQQAPPSPLEIEPLKLLNPLPVRAPGLRIELETVEQAISFIDKNVPRELATLPRWAFARALLLEARKTRKSRDLRAAGRQLNQALSNERWLDVD